MFEYSRWALRRLSLEHLQTKLEQNNTSLDFIHALSLRNLIESHRKTRASQIIERYGGNRPSGQQTSKEENGEQQREKQEKHMLQALTEAGLSLEAAKQPLGKLLMLPQIRFTYRKRKLEAEITRRTQKQFYTAEDQENYHRRLEEDKTRSKEFDALKRYYRRLGQEQNLGQLQEELKQVNFQLKQHPLNTPDIRAAGQLIAGQAHNTPELRAQLEDKCLPSIKEIADLAREQQGGLAYLLKQQKLLEAQITKLHRQETGMK